ncbi:uncharacterized protein LOC127860331 isoform X1 [Dreissena polymorpha]|uniref:uncharacterized protein LOC127860331 isoform X1 n=1 Tax=Dreissena polymorpha TaxID=45954 RepID=UPI002263F437|nr:uncharacterized protein LOC127860331 isoform X1 [Dreissena polymorpha]
MFMFALGGQWVANSIDMYPSSWVDANKICLSNATLPATVASVFKANFSDALNQVHWTGVIRTNTVLMADDADFITTHGKTTYAFMTDNGKIYFEERGYRSSLCTATAAATTRPTFHFSTTTKLSEGIETTSSTQSNPSPVSPTISDSTLTESFTSHQELKQFDNVSEQSPKSSAVGIGIGVSVAVICLVVATITIIVLKKRGLLPCKLGADKKQPAVEKVAFEENITYTKGLDDTVKNHNYFILEKGSLSVNENIDDYNTQCESNHENGEDGTYNSIEDTEEPYKHFKDNNGEYDYTTNNLTSGSNTRKPDNVYNKLKLNRPGDYNHVDGREHNVTQSGNDYDIKSPVVAPSNADVSDYNHITHPVEGNVDYDINTGRKVKLAPSDASGYAHVKI